ncbi:hypothetical protein BMS3Abin04_00602 [bacterium BMS3Abin04]|nr:hypothetical protein BMS3Abin04_00602 [bacterium BMS3Abin04]
MHQKSKEKFLILITFAIAMGFLESIVVVYLRELYYPNGFFFPLKLIPTHTYSIEIIREISTIVMLISIGFIAGKNRIQKFAFFLFVFGVWDIAYYLGLKLFLNWPASFLTWDLLFLIPIPWVGPVLAPVICSVGMILISLLFIRLNDNGATVKFELKELLIMTIGILIIFATYIHDYSVMIIKGGYLSGFFSLFENQQFRELSAQYVPEFYNWYLFFIGVILISVSVLMIYNSSLKQREES